MIYEEHSFYSDIKMHIIQKYKITYIYINEDVKMIKKMKKTYIKMKNIYKYESKQSTIFVSYR